MEQLIFHVLLPFALEKLRLRQLAGKVLKGWLLWAGRALGLHAWLLHPEVNLKG